MRLPISLLLLLTLAAELPADMQRYTRFEAQFTPSLYIDIADCKVISSDVVAFELYPLMTAQERWFVAREIEFLNKERGLPIVDDIMIIPNGVQITVPVYRRYTGGKGGCYDIRNWHVAVCKGRKYGVSPALLIAIRSHENPRRERDRYAYGVVAYKNTDLWTQAEWGAKIVARIAKRQGWSPAIPTRANLYRLALVYVGRGEASARHWSSCVWTIMQWAQG